MINHCAIVKIDTFFLSNHNQMQPELRKPAYKGKQKTSRLRLPVDYFMDNSKWVYLGLF